MSEENNLIETVESKIQEVRTTSLDISFNEILDMYTNKELIIKPAYQRGFRWSDEQQSRFIESILLEMPLPPIFFVEDQEGVYELIDGLQRISSYLRFRGVLLNENQQKLDALVLDGCDILEELNGKNFEQLAPSLKIKLKRNFIRALILKKETNTHLRYHMFKRLNTGGELLSEQEIRNCTIRLLGNEFIDFINEMTKNEDYVNCMDIVTDNQKKKMFLEECALKFFALKNNLENYTIGMGDFLTKYMEEQTDQKNDGTFDYSEEKNIFEITFKILNVISGDESFATVDKNRQKIVKQFAAYQFEAFSIGIQNYIEIIDVNNTELIEKLKTIFYEVKLNSHFQSLTSGNWLHKQPKVKERISFVENKISEIL
jgi:hypothetical protein